MPCRSDFEGRYQSTGVEAVNVEAVSDVESREEEELIGVLAYTGRTLIFDLWQCKSWQIYC